MNPPTLLQRGPRKCLVLTSDRASEVDLALLPAPFDLDEPFAGVIWNAGPQTGTTPPQLTMR